MSLACKALICIDLITKFMNGKVNGMYVFLLINNVYMPMNCITVACEQQMCRPDCDFAQSNKRLCYSLPSKYNNVAYYKQSFILLAGLSS